MLARHNPAQQLYNEHTMKNQNTTIGQIHVTEATPNARDALRMLGMHSAHK